MAKILYVIDLRARDFAARVDSRGWVNAVRFLQQFEKSTKNYTTERQHVLPDLDPAESVRRTHHA